MTHKAKDKQTQGRTGLRMSGYKGWCIIAPIEQYSGYK